MTPDTTLDWANGGAPSVYTNRLDLSQAWFDALYGARSQRREVPHAAAGAVRRECAPNRPDGRSGLAFENSHATTIARAAARVRVEAMDRSALRSSRPAVRRAPVRGAPRAPGCGRVIVLRGSGGLAIAIAYTERGLSIAAHRAGPAARLALGRAREALVAQGIIHRTFTPVSASIGGTP